MSALYDFNGTVSGCSMQEIASLSMEQAGICTNEKHSDLFGTMLSDTRREGEAREVIEAGVGLEVLTCRLRGRMMKLLLALQARDAVECASRTVYKDVHWCRR